MSLYRTGDNKVTKATTTTTTTIRMRRSSLFTTVLMMMMIMLLCFSSTSTLVAVAEAKWIPKNPSQNTLEQEILELREWAEEYGFHWIDELGFRKSTDLGVDSRTSSSTSGDGVRPPNSGSMEDGDVQAYAKMSIPKGKALLVIPMMQVYKGETPYLLGQAIAEPLAKPSIVEYSSYFRLLKNRKSPPLPSTVRKLLAIRCYPAHFYSLYRTTRKLFTKLPVTHSQALAISRGFRNPLSFAPGQKGKREVIVPILDFLNHRSTKYANAKVIFEEGTIVHESGKKRNDVVKLVTTKDIQKGEEVTISYGNIRNVVDSVDSYGFMNASDFDTVPAQVYFRLENDDDEEEEADKKSGVREEDHLAKYTTKEKRDVEKLCGTESEKELTFEVATGKPSEKLIHCGSLAMLRGGRNKKLRQLFSMGVVPPHFGLSLRAASLIQISNAAERLIHEEYTIHDIDSCNDAKKNLNPTSEELVVVDLVQKAAVEMGSILKKVIEYCDASASKAIEELEQVVKKMPRRGGGSSSSTAAMVPQFHEAAAQMRVEERRKREAGVATEDRKREEQSIRRTADGQEGEDGNVIIRDEL